MMRTSWRKTSWRLVSCEYLLWSQSLPAHHWCLTTTARRPCWLWWAAPGSTSCCNPRNQSRESASNKSQLVFFSPWHHPISPSSFPHPDQGCHNRKPGKGVLFFLKMFHPDRDKNHVSHSDFPENIYLEKTKQRTTVQNSDLGVGIWTERNKMLWLMTIFKMNWIGQVSQWVVSWSYIRFQKMYGLCMD